jgi:aldehyde:ferredoxin oxidoreductase
MKSQKDSEGSQDMRTLLRIDMASKTSKAEDVDLLYPKAGGRALTSAIVSSEVNPNGHAFGVSNKLVIAPGLLCGTSCVNSGRLSIGAKSPLTGTIKESNVGGTAAMYLGKMNIAGIVVENVSEKDKLFCLLVNKDSAELVPADDLKGLGNYDLVEKLKATYGKKVSILSIGPAGENRLATATVAVTDPEGRPCRHAGRGGIGAVMGSKGLKAIIVDPTDAPGVAIRDKEAFKKASHFLRTLLVESEYTAPKTGAYAKYGMNLIMDPVNDSGALPSYNFRQGQFEGIAKINGQALYDTIRQRGGKYNHSGCSNCIIQCSNVYVDPKGDYVTSSLEYETLFALGSNCGIDDLDALAQMDRLCDDYGIDTIETGCAIAVAMEGGVKSFGDAGGAIELIKEIGIGTPMGRILGSGTEVTGKAFGVIRVPVVKGQSMPGYDPRVIKGLGVTYATSTMGADHTSGFAAGFTEDDRNPSGKARMSKDSQDLIGFIDTIGICFAVTDVANQDNGGVEAMVNMVNAVYGWALTMADMLQYGKKVLQMEKAFNQKAGFTAKDNRLPEFMHTETISPHRTVFDVSYDEIDAMF